MIRPAHFAAGYIKVSREFKNYCREAVSLEVRFQIVDRKGREIPSSAVTCLVPGSENRPALLVWTCSSCCPQTIDPRQGPVSYTDQYSPFKITGFRSFLPVLSFSTRTRICSRAGVSQQLWRQLVPCAFMLP